jgi:hypothetical protein
LFKPPLPDLPGEAIIPDQALVSRLPGGTQLIARLTFLGKKMLTCHVNYWYNKNKYFVVNCRKGGIVFEINRYRAEGR